jgi:glycosyltransferase involved in cell wall biosynthesis
MKLGVDARMMYGAWKHRGIGRYTSSILAPLANEDVVVFLPGNQSIDTYKNISVGNSFFAWWEQVVLPKLAKRENLSYLLCPSITSPITQVPNTKKIVVIYDLIFMQSFSDLPPSHSLYNNLGRLYRRFTAPKAYRSADVLIAISEYSRTELHERFGIPIERVHVIHCSITNDWFIKTAIPANKRQRYLLTVSGDSPSKNLPRLLEAFANLSKRNLLQDFKLRIVGVAAKSQGFLLNKASNLGIAEHVVFEKFVSNEGLQTLYREAWASLSLSLYEGFGIPIVEAMASGTPIVSSNTTSLPEVAGDVAIYADPREVDQIASAILKIIEASAEERDRMSTAGMNRATMFSEGVISEKIAEFWSHMKG